MPTMDRVRFAQPKGRKFDIECDGELEMTSETLGSVHFYVDLIALVAAVLALIPIYKDYGTKYFVTALVVLVLCVLSLGVIISRLHRNELVIVQSRIQSSLISGPKTSDELAQSLGHKEVALMDEAMDVLLDSPESRVTYEVISLKNCDGSLVVQVKRYYLLPQVSRHE